jgi:hypothetical protein
MSTEDQRLLFEMVDEEQKRCAQQHQFLTWKHSDGKKTIPQHEVSFPFAWGIPGPEALRGQSPDLPFFKSLVRRRRKDIPKAEVVDDSGDDEVESENSSEDY